MPPRAIITPTVLALLGTLAAQARSQAPSAADSLNDLHDLSRYVGTFPCVNGLLRSPTLRRAVAALLGPVDAANYGEYLENPNCGKIERKDGYLVLDLFFAHSGGFSSLILVRERDAVMFVFWLRGEVGYQQDHVYGPRPVPPAVLHIAERNMNEGWGHVACFTPQADSLAIDLYRRGDPETGICKP